MRKIWIIAFSIIFLSGRLAFAVQDNAVITTQDGPQIQSIMAEGGPIHSKHMQSGKVNANQHHTIGDVQVSTKDYGNWGIYYLNPNSDDRTSWGAAYVTDPWTLNLIGPTKFELSGALGLVTGYQDFPVPLLAAHARLVLIDTGKFDAGIAAAAMPYIMEDRNGKNKAGIVATTPFLSLRYKFQ